MDQNRMLSVIGGILSLAALVTIIYYAFVVPGDIAHMLAENGGIPPEYETRVALSRFFTACGIYVLPLPLVGIGLSIWWWVASGRRAAK